MRSLFMIITLVLAFSSIGLAYGPSGCGFGSLIIQKDTIVSQIFAETSNFSFLSQPFGITSGTSNCHNSGFAIKEKEAEAFAEANMQSLEVDMARGQGESLHAFAQILGCRDGAISSFGKMSQSQYENIFPRGSAHAGSDASTFIHSVEKAMDKDPEVKRGCLQQTS